MSQEDDLSFQEIIKQLRSAGLAYGMGTLPIIAADAMEELLRRPLIPGSADGGYLTHLESEVKRLQELCDLKQNLTAEVVAMKALADHATESSRTQIKRAEAAEEKAKYWEGAYSALIAQRDAALKDYADLQVEHTGLQNTFDLMWKADMRAIKVWQEATGKDHIWPDRTKLTVWLLEQLDQAKASKDEAYSERNKLVAYLAHSFPSGTMKTDIPGWDPEWHNCVFIDTPHGQMSWHYHDSEAHMFDDLRPYQGQWDGHTTEQKYKRLAHLGGMP